MCEGVEVMKGTVVVRWEHCDSWVYPTTQFQK